MRSHRNRTSRAQRTSSGCSVAGVVRSRTVSFALAIAAVALTPAAAGWTGASPDAARCRPTPRDALGPFYEPGAPVRSKVGSGYVLTGTVRAASSCRALPRARIEFWLVNPRGEYDDAHRATVFADRRGRYRFQSNRPVSYSGRPPHIHIRVTARRHRPFVTQHYPRRGASRARFDLVIP